MADPIITKEALDKYQRENILDTTEEVVLWRWLIANDSFGNVEDCLAEIKKQVKLGKIMELRNLMIPKTCQLKETI